MGDRLWTGKPFRCVTTPISLRTIRSFTFFFLFLFSDILATVIPIGLKVCLMVELQPGEYLTSSGSDIFRGLQMWGQNGAQVDRLWPSDTDFCYLTAYTSQTVRRSVTSQSVLTATFNSYGNRQISTPTTSISLNRSTKKNRHN